MRRLLLVVGCLLTPVSLQADWTVFRGQATQIGLAKGKLPERLDILWRFTVEEGFENGLAVMDDTVYAPCLDEHLYALEATTGKLRWKTKGGSFKAPPAVQADRIVVGDIDGNIFAFSRGTGKQLWKFEARGEAGGANFDGEDVLVPSHDEHLYKISKEGKLLWKFKTEGAIYGSVSVAAGKTFLVGCDSKLHVIDTQTGKADRSVDLEAQTAGTAAVSADVIYIGTMGNEVKAIDWKKGEVVWTYKPRRSDGFYSSPAVNSSYVVIGSRDKRLHCLNRKTGVAEWTFLTGNKVDSSPVIVGDRVVFGSMDEHLYVLELQTGKEVQKIALDGPISASPAVVGSKVYIGTQKGSVYCLGAK
ncbi:MAG: PQQ-binding-like beta-propeller repeat protein [Gemmataceae bacterium]